MSWISGKITARSADIISELSSLVAEKGSNPVIPAPEVIGQADTTLELLVEAVESGRKTPLLDRWGAIGSEYAKKKVAMAEIPRTLELLKRAVWKVLEGEVESGTVRLTDLVDSMMAVESILDDCWFALLRSYLGSRDIQVTAMTTRMEALYSLTEVLSMESDVGNLYRQIADKVACITGLSRCAILMFDEEGRLGPVASNHPDGLEKLKGADDAELAALAAVAALGGPVILERQGGNPPEIEGLMEKYGSPLLLVPMSSGDKDLGLILLDEAKPGEFTGEHIDMAVATANQAAIAMEKGRFIAEMESRLKHMAAIGIVARTLTPQLNPQEQMRGILEIATALMRADRGVIMRLEEMFGKLEVVASLGEGDRDGHGTLERVAAWAAEHGETVVLRKGIADPRFAGLEMRVEASITSPLMVRDRAIGVISVATDRPGTMYTGDDLEMFGNFAAQAAISIENIQLYERLQDTYIGTIAALAAAIEARDPYTVGHSTRVTKYAVAIAEAMGLPGEEVEELRLAGLLHDLGKIGVPDNILNKPDSLSEEEYSAIRMHPTMSIRIIEPLPHLGNLIPIIYHHHEHYDGTGYVDGKSGSGIPLGARIISVADSFEAMTSDRPYRAALSREEAVAELKRNAGSQFDPEVVRVFVELLEKSAPG